MDFFTLNNELKENKSDILKTWSLIKEGCKMLLPDLDAEYVDKFANENMFQLSNYIDYHGIHENGPIEKFLVRFYKVNGNLDAFIDNESCLEVLFMAYGNDVISDNQLKDTCDEDERVLLIYNNSFWKIIRDSYGIVKYNDFKWLIQTELWCQHFYYAYAEDDNFCNNSRINNALKEVFKETLGDPDNTDK